MADGTEENRDPSLGGPNAIGENNQSMQPPISTSSPEQSESNRVFSEEVKSSENPDSNAQDKSD